MSEAPQEGIAVVLIAGAQSSISESLTARISQAFADTSFSGQAWRSLKDRHAYEASIQDKVWSRATASEMTGRCKDVIGDIPIDVGVVDIVDRRKKVLIADMDSTIIEQECLDELAGYAGLKDEIASVTEQAMRGELNFEEALRARVAKLKGLPAEKLSDTLEDKVSIMPGAKTLIATMRAHGATTVLASGGFTYFTKRVADRVGFDQNIGNQLDIEDERLTGT
ncbi:MAG: HAD-IB family phosphatase, partial [Pseudomonadota bacterium]